jgi:hypothetical protein
VYLIAKAGTNRHLFTAIIVCTIPQTSVVSTVVSRLLNQREVQGSNPGTTSLFLFGIFTISVSCVGTKLWDQNRTFRHMGVNAPWAQRGEGGGGTKGK